MDLLQHHLLITQHTTINNTTASPTTPKRKCLFANMQNMQTKKTKFDSFIHLEDEISRYLHEDYVDSMFLLNHPTIIQHYLN